MTAHTSRSPRISHVSWGRMTVDGLGEGKDFKLYPGGGRAWDWAETGTRHEPPRPRRRGAHATIASILQLCPPANSIKSSQKGGHNCKINANGSSTGSGTGR